jgi:hypothetical protein
VRKKTNPKTYLAVSIVLAAMVPAIAAAEVIVSFPLDVDPGWTTEGQWEFGVPLGGGSHCYDPTSGHTGTNVYGYNLSGDYADNIPAYYLTTTALDCSGYNNVSLNFWRWLGVESASYDHATVEVSNDGSIWSTVWDHTGGSFCDGAWIECDYDISSVADDQSTVYIRWTMGPTDVSVTYPGWNIDDICLLGDLTNDLQITPSEDFYSSGYEAGPFEPLSKSYTLTNNGPNSLDWTATVTQPWLDIAPTSGTLNPGEPNTVVVSLNTIADTLPTGIYNDTITFTNITSGIAQMRGVTLEVTAIPGQIEVTDSIGDPNDLNMPFGIVIIGLVRTEHITIANNDPDYNLIISDILLNNQSVATGQSPEFSVTLPAITSDRKESTASYVPIGWIIPHRPPTKLVVHSGYRALAGSANVLLLASGDDPTILRTGLSAFPDIDAVDYFDCSITAPTVDDLISYDVVVAMSNSSYANATQTGNALADYVDTGGKVIQAVATFAIGGGWELAGRFVTEGYGPFVHGGAEFFGHSLGNFDADHPIMDGVTTLTDGLPAGVSLQGGAEWVADWNNGTPLVATQDRDVVGVNIFAFDSGDFTGDVPLLFHNAIVWLVGQTAFELELPPGGLPITIPPSDSVIIDVNFVPTGVEEYESVLLIQSNDEDEPEIEVQLTGTGITDYLEIVPEEAIEFCGHPGGPFDPLSKSYTLTNVVATPLSWTAGKTQTWLDVDPNGGTVYPGEPNMVVVSLNTIANTLPEGSYSDTVTFTNITSGVAQMREVNLEVFTAPEIWVAPDSFDVNVPEGGTITETMTIGNTGDAVLNFNIASREIPPPEAPAAKSAVSELGMMGETIILEYEFSEPVISKDGEYDRVSIEGLERYLCTGAPIVPVRPATALIPFGKEVIATRVVPVDTRELAGTYQLGPAQKPYPLSYQGEVQATEPDPAIYEQAAPWPGIDYEIVTTQSKRGYQLLIVNLFPLQYSPATGEISYAAKLKLEIDLADFQNENVLKPSAAVRAQLGGTIDNPSALKWYPAEDDSAQKLDGQGVLPGGGPYRYVIITNEALEDAPGPWNFQALRDAKNARGMTATIVTTEWIYATYDGTRPDGGTDNQTRIRNFLIDAYQTWGTEYVLLAGTNSIVPARMFWVEAYIGEQDTMPVDMYYGCVDPCSCTFDYDADGLYGEPTDGVGGNDVDLYAEIYVGRAAVENATEVENFIRKTLTYDLAQNEYLPRIAMVGEYLGFGGVAEYAKDAMEQIRLGGEYDGYFTCGFENHGQPEFIDFVTVGCLPEDPCCCWPLYDADHEDYDWPKSDLLCLMNGGIHVFNHLGHANYTYDMKLYTSDLASLTNTDYFFIYSQGCMPGGFDTTNCFAEVITSMEEGAFAVVMNARFGWGTYGSTDGPSHRFGRQFWDAVLCEDMLEMGRANQDSKEDNIPAINEACMRWCYYELNLFGDPAQQFRFTEVCEWLNITPDEGSCAPGDPNDVDVVFEPGNLTLGTYKAEIMVSSNDPVTPTVPPIPVTMTVVPLEVPCDFEPDGDVDLADLAAFAAHWPDTDCGACGGADLTWDGNVDLYDLLVCAENWLAITQ